VRSELAARFVIVSVKKLSDSKLYELLHLKFPQWKEEIGFSNEQTEVVSQAYRCEKINHCLFSWIRKI
jgi:hypothetical protein